MPKFSDLIVRRFAELEDQAAAIPLVESSDRFGRPFRWVRPEEFYAWSSCVLMAIQGAFGDSSPHFTQFSAHLPPPTHSVSHGAFATLHGIFLGAKSDVDGGYLFDLQRSVSGEIFADFVEAAKAALAEDHHVVAAVLACAALEDALKRFAISKDLPVDEKSMSDVINLLKSKSLVSGAMNTLLTGMPRIRNRALHGEWSSLTIVDTRAVISCVEQFLLANF